MKLTKIKTKIYYKIANQVINSEKLSLPDELAQKRCLFLYFDYEREFGGHETDISDKHVNNLLKLLNKYHYKTTWYTVGKIFVQYPSSIKNILKYGHEIGSHTFNHIPPLKTANKQIQEDFIQFRNVATKTCNIKGFHSPKGLWSLGCIKLLSQFGYLYDVASSGRDRKPFISNTQLGKKQKLFRLNAVGDDYSLLNKKNSEKQTLDYLINITDRIDSGSVGGIGFHPWVLFSDERIFNGFKLYLDYLSAREDIIIKPAEYYVKAVKCES